MTIDCHAQQVALAMTATQILAMTEFSPSHCGSFCLFIPLPLRRNTKGVGCHTEVSQVTEVSCHCEPCLHGAAIHTRAVIASERSERGNLSYNTKKVDCHALDSAKMQNLIARNDGSINSFNDKKTHPQTPLVLREGAYCGLPRAISCARDDDNFFAPKTFVILSISEVSQSATSL